MFDELNTGDIILFNGQDYWFSSLVEYVTGSIYSHIGIILKDPIYIDPKLKGVYLLESGSETIADGEDGQEKFGVQITDFTEIYDQYVGRIYWRKLKFHEVIKEVAFIGKLRETMPEIHSVIHNKPYDYFVNDLLDAKIKHHTENDRRTDRFFCSALASFVYTKLGLLRDDTDWSLMTPKEFDMNNLKELENGAYLENEMRIK